MRSTIAAAFIAASTMAQAQYLGGQSPEACEGAQVRALCGTPGLPADDYFTAPHMNYGVNNPSFTLFRLQGDKCVRTTYGTGCRVMCYFPKAYCTPETLKPDPVAPERSMLPKRKR